LRPAWAKVLEAPSQSVAGYSGAHLLLLLYGKHRWEDHGPGWPRPQQKGLMEQLMW
jgi:hypothetical protein